VKSVLQEEAEDTAGAEVPGANAIDLSRDEGTKPSQEDEEIQAWQRAYGRFESRATSRGECESKVEGQQDSRGSWRC
jgi:hypothetical protein